MALLATATLAQLSTWLKSTIVFMTSIQFHADFKTRFYCAMLCRAQSSVPSVCDVQILKVPAHNDPNMDGRPSVIWTTAHKYTLGDGISLCLLNFTTYFK